MYILVGANGPHMIHKKNQAKKPLPAMPQTAQNLLPAGWIKVEHSPGISTVVCMAHTWTFWERKNELNTFFYF